ncbi:MAG: hypothetical protein ACYTG0_04580 [Planctomycetota bacterium]|jgi:hypothetical protein
MSSLSLPVASGNTQSPNGAPRTIHLDPREVPDVFRRAFPGYRGRKFVAEVRESVTLDANYWSGGTRYTYRGVDLVTGEILSPECDEYGNPFTHPEAPTVALEPHKAIVCHKVFCGKDLGLTIHVHPENVAKLLPMPTELTPSERIVLGYTSSLKASYGGVSNYRFKEASRETGITLDGWNLAKDSLIGKGLLNRRGAITTKGRNALAQA